MYFYYFLNKSRTYLRCATGSLDTRSEVITAVKLGDGPSPRAGPFCGVTRAPEISLCRLPAFRAAGPAAVGSMLCSRPLDLHPMSPQAAHPLPCPSPAPCPAGQCREARATAPGELRFREPCRCPHELARACGGSAQPGASGTP